MSDYGRTLAFQGHSDDLFCMEGGAAGEPDEVGCFSGMAAIRLETPGGEGLHVLGAYALDSIPTPGAAWIIGLQQLDEDKPLPPWPMRWSTADNQYSLRLEIDVPAGVVATTATQ